ncbi:MBL fold metallo-hydrolase [Virgibacillus ihumii]|uniref:MBL fold metallo-hydrolase n=1 Tax=Virgibacillus ihumii TaxID=2686091 RepID=UPI00157CC794|nr:MBL fold metallo-hydrolase [Virgibacillus ihumii]
MLEELGLKRIRLDLPFRLNHVNCFVAEGENGWQVIDTGMHNKETADRWRDELAGKSVTDIFITHYHPDHFGYAGGLQELTSANVYMSEIDAEAGLNAWQHSFIETLYENYLATGIDKKTAARMTKNTKEFVPRVTPYPQVDHYFQEGQIVQIGNFTYEVFFTPGHSDGLVTFYNNEKNVLLSTDHILPKITPNISYWFHGDPNPLHSFLTSLEKIRKLDADFVIPSHGKPFYGANNRIDEIKAHHDNRLLQTLNAVSEGGTAADVCQKLFQKELTIHETRFAIGETLAHLEYLRYKGECDRELNKGSYWYYRK